MVCVTLSQAKHCILCSQKNYSKVTNNGTTNRHTWSTGCQVDNFLIIIQWIWLALSYKMLHWILLKAHAKNLRVSHSLALTATTSSAAFCCCHYFCWSLSYSRTWLRLCPLNATNFFPFPPFFSSSWISFSLCWDSKCDHVTALDKIIRVCFDTAAFYQYIWVIRTTTCTTQ